MYDLDDYWRKFPPAHVLVATYLEYKAPPKPVRGARAVHGARTAGESSSRLRAIQEDAPSIEEIMATLGLRKA